MSDQYQGQTDQRWRANETVTGVADRWNASELFQGVLTRRAFAFLIDVFVISIPILLGYIIIAILGVVTLGLGWGLFFVASPASAVWAIAYYGMTLGGVHSATVGMRMMGLQMRTWNDEPAYFVLGAAHAILYWVSVSLLTPFVLLVGLFNSRSRLLHDLVLGTVVINTAVREEILGPAPQQYT